MPVLTLAPNNTTVYVGLYPGATTFPGPAVYPGAGNSLSLTAQSAGALTAAARTPNSL